MGRSLIMASNLQFMDDSIFFSRVRIDDMYNLKLLLLGYRFILDLKINPNKNTLSGIKSVLARSLDLPSSLVGSSHTWAFCSDNLRVPFSET